MKGLFLPLILCLVMCFGCARNESVKNAESGMHMNNTSESRPDRMLIWKASMGIEVHNVSEAMGKSIAIVEKNGGYLEWKTENSETNAHARLRIPARVFKETINSFETLGTVTSRNINGTDVTGQYIDVEARLKNKSVLRDRLKQLLDKATNVKDILAIEAELNRVQSDMDAMEGTIKSLKGQVDFAAVDLTFERDRILGPLGYVFKGLWWGVKKMFVLRD